MLLHPPDTAVRLCSAPCRVAPASDSTSVPAEAPPSEASHQPPAEQDPPLLHAHSVAPADVQDPPLLHAHGVAPADVQDPPLLHAHGVAPADVQDPPLLHAHGVAPADMQDPPLLHAHGLPPGGDQVPPRDAEAAQGPNPEPAGHGAARDANELPVEVTNETPSGQRIELYRSRACLFVTTRILVVDLLSARVHGNQACFYLLITHRLPACARVLI